MKIVPEYNIHIGHNSREEQGFVEEMILAGHGAAIQRRPDTPSDAGVTMATGCCLQFVPGHRVVQPLRLEFIAGHIFTLVDQAPASDMQIELSQILNN